MKAVGLFTVVLLHCFFIEAIMAQHEYAWMEESDLPDIEYIDVFLDDTNYYVTRDYLFVDYGKYYMKYFMSTGALQYELRDSLPDGCYALFEVSRKEAEKMPKNVLNSHIVATGCFENKMKQGKFTFISSYRDITIKKAKNAPILKSEYKSIDFTNDTVNGDVQEYFGQALYHLAQYKMGRLDGYFIHASSIMTLIRLYKEGILIKEITIE